MFGVDVDMLRDRLGVNITANSRPSETQVQSIITAQVAVVLSRLRNRGVNVDALASSPSLDAYLVVQQIVVDLTASKAIAYSNRGSTQFARETYKTAMEQLDDLVKTPANLGQAMPQGDDAPGRFVSSLSPFMQQRRQARLSRGEGRLIDEMADEGEL